MNTEKPTQTEDKIDSIETAELDNVTGGCAACGMANCTMGAAPAAANPAVGAVARSPWFSAFNRR